MTFFLFFSSYFSPLLFSHTSLPFASQTNDGILAATDANNASRLAGTSSKTRVQTTPSTATRTPQDNIKDTQDNRDSVSLLDLFPLFR
ncbi:MAG: hypothetical protein J3R72DRAFT_232993 [Linnemannia gamsii]|nr:MAG: hypothetical protein J3R72DRAFT_232993 [Linnemannia gamsii]